MAGPKLLFSSAAFFARPLDESFELIADCGYAGAEVMVTKDPASQDGPRIASLAKAHGLSVGALHAPALLVTRKVWGTDPIGKIRRAIHEAHDAEIPLVVMHPPYRWQSRYRGWLEDGLLEAEEGTGVTVAIENMFPVHVGTRPLTFHANQDLDVLTGLPNLVLDTSHAAVAKHDIVDVRQRFGQRLRHVHLSDNAGKGWDSHLPPGRGMLPIGAFLDDLVASGFEGTVSLEVDLRDQLTQPARLRELMVAMRESVEERLGA